MHMTDEEPLVGGWIFWLIMIKSHFAHQWQCIRRAMGGFVSSPRTTLKRSAASRTRFQHCRP